MSHSRQTVPMLVIALAALSPSQPASADDWPQWRGANRDGVWTETGIVKRFESPQLDIAWRAEVSTGYSGPTVAGGRVFVTDRVVKPKQVERIHCFDETTGTSIWTHTYDCPYENVGYDAGPRASVTIDSGKAYALGSMGHLFCLDAAKGNVLWGHDLNKEYSIRMPIWGIAASPIVEDGNVIVQIGGSDNACLVAFDQDSGKEKWRSLKDRASYSAPIVIEQAGKRVLVVYTGDNVVGIDPASGSVYWSHPFAPSRGTVLGIATPVFHQNTLFLSNFYDGSLLLGVDPTELKIKKLWQRVGKDEKHTDSIQSLMSTPYLNGDHIYGVDSYGELRCLKLANGDRVWESLAAVPKARWSNIHFVRNGEHVWMFNERGELIITKLSPSGYEEISRTKLLEPTTDQLRRRGGVCWSHPAFANRHVFARNGKELVCASLEAK